MFSYNFLNMIGNYEDRKVALWEDGGGRMVSTARVSDGRQPFETAFQHPDYHDGKMVIVEAYDSKADAQKGHKKWLKIMTEGPLPDKLIDCANAEVAELGVAFGMTTVFPKRERRRKPCA